jgi:pimeloyl-ACP methyl ester carboxylesterase
MHNLRLYGQPPFTVAVLHGGPGAPGTMAPVARELATEWGVLEPLQTADSLDGQVEELRAVLDEHADLPVTLIGSSWGAMLGYIVAARYPVHVRKLILVGSGVYEARYAAGIEQTRLDRLSEAERAHALELMELLERSDTADKALLMNEMGRIYTKADAYDPLTLDTEGLEAQYEMLVRVWSDAETLRASGELLALGKHIACPVLALHGDYDPHPAAGVREPLSSGVRDFRFVLLAHCGHLPWIERQARDEFFRRLRAELRG